VRQLPSSFRAPEHDIAIFLPCIVSLPFCTFLLLCDIAAMQLLLVSGANRALGLSDELFVLGDSVILTVLGQVGGPEASQGL